MSKEISDGVRARALEQGIKVGEDLPFHMLVSGGEEREEDNEDEGSEVVPVEKYKEKFSKLRRENYGEGFCVSLDSGMLYLMTPEGAVKIGMDTEPKIFDLIRRALDEDEPLDVAFSFLYSSGNSYKHTKAPDLEILTDEERKFREEYREPLSEFVEDWYNPLEKIREEMEEDKYDLRDYEETSLNKIFQQRYGLTRDAVENHLEELGPK